MLSNEQIERFSRQIILPEIGAPGQQRLLESRVVFVGLTAATSTALAYLAAAGVGEIGVVDDGVVGDPEAPLAFSAADRGQPRSGAAARLVTTLHPDGRALAFADPADALASRPWNLAILHGERVAATYNRSIIDARIPGIVLSATAGHAWAAGFAGHRTDAPCWRCGDWAPWPEPSAGLGKGAQAPSALGGVVGSIVAVEAVKILLGIGTPIIGRLVTWESRSLAVRVTTLDKDAHCTACASPGPSSAAAPARSA
jgi:molybdopterin/thiamine biosynthesis adenylyltransferase